MVQEYFRSISNWEEWKALWEKNDTLEIAIGLLHIGPRVTLMPFLSANRDLPDDLGHEFVRFYLQKAHSWETSKDNQRGIGEKAYQVLVNLLSKHWDKLVSDDELTQEIIDFFAEGYCFFFHVQPYRKEAEDIVKGIWNLVTDGRRNKFAPLSSPREEVKVSRYQTARALVKAELFDFLLEKQILEAIPVLQEWLAPLIKGKLKMQAITATKEKPVPPPPIHERIKAELDNPRTWIFRFALQDFQTRRAARALLELIIKRDVPLPTYLT